MHRRRFLTSLAAVAVAPAVAIPPAAPAFDLQAHYDAQMREIKGMLQRMHEEEMARLDAWFRDRDRPRLVNDELSRYVHELNRREHDRLNVAALRLEDGDAVGSVAARSSG
jgi:hypothetical protein